MGLPEGKKPFGRNESRWEKILKRIFKKWYEEAWSELIWVRIDRWRGFVNSVMNFRVLKTSGNFFIF